MNLLFPDGTISADFRRGGGSHPNASEDDLIDALAALERGDIEYVGLEDDSAGIFMQVAGDASSGYVLEYNDGQDDAMMQAQGTLGGTQITDALIAFLNHDNTWRMMFRWERITY